jgi:hypothetical protein
VNLEFSRPIDARHIDEQPHRIVADEAERVRLAERFELLSVDRLEATLRFSRDGHAVTATGRLMAKIVQPCAVSGEPLGTTIDEPLLLRFVERKEVPPGQEEIELTPEDCDEVEYDGHVFELGEAVAQSLALAIDPYAVGPEADTVRKKVGLLDEGAAGPFAALAALKKGD